MPTLFIQVCAFSKNSSPFLVAVVKDGTLPLADVKTLIPNIVGLTFCNSEGYLQGLACDGDSIQPPHHDGWLFNENYYAIVGPGNTTVHQENILPAMADHSTKVEPVKHIGVQIPVAPSTVDEQQKNNPSTVDEQQKNNGGPGFNTTSFGPPALVDVSSAGAKGNDNINTEMHVQGKTTGDENSAICDNANDGEGDDDDADDGADDVAVDELKEISTHMLGFRGFSTRNTVGLKTYLSQFGELLHFRMRRTRYRKDQNRNKKTGVADVLFRDLSAQESALQAQHVFNNKQCSLTQEAYRQVSGACDTSKDTVVLITGLGKKIKTEDVEKLLAGYAGVKKVFVKENGCNAYVDFETTFYALQLVKNKPRLEGRPLGVWFAKNY